MQSSARQSSSTTSIDRLSSGPAWSPVVGPSGAEPPGTASPGPNRSRKRWLLVALVAELVVIFGIYEARTSALQSWFFSRWAARLTYAVESGPSPLIAFPDGGPFDRRFGYTRIPEFTQRLERQGFGVVAQARFSTAAARLAAWGFQPPYPEPASVGLVIRDRAGIPLYDARSGHGVFTDPEDIPPLVARMLVFIENRRLDDLADPRENPVIDWGRFAKAGFSYAGRKLGLPFASEGGSTLATQLEKFQHSRGGLTSSPLEKLRQMTAASLKVYKDGTDTREGRQLILLKYLNGIPLAAAPGWGEVNGLGDGLMAWFGLQAGDVFGFLASDSVETRAWALKHVLTLLCAGRSPSHYLLQDRTALEARVKAYARLMEKAGVLETGLADRIANVRVRFRGAAPTPLRPVLQRKATGALRIRLGDLLGEASLYDLDRLHLTVESTLDLPTQQTVARLLGRLRDPGFLRDNGLLGEHLLGGGDPRDVVYSLLLFERTPEGNVERIHYDTLDQPFDINSGMKMELGSTAKLRTVVHYLEVMAELHQALAHQDPRARALDARDAKDPLTRWAAQTVEAAPAIGLEAFLAQALDRTYSGNPGEAFFTGGGAQRFGNFERSENFRRYTIREGLVQSVNLVYIRLMRDLVRYHAGRLPYDAERVLGAPDDPMRKKLLEEIAEAESQAVLAKAYAAYRTLSAHEIAAQLLGAGSDLRRQAMLFFAWHPGADEGALTRWLGPAVSAGQVQQLVKAYGNPQLTLADFGYLLGRHPLEVWCAGKLAETADLDWPALLSESGAARRIASRWLFATRNRHAQDLRLRIRIEQDAFLRMTPAWRQLGFPFPRLVPSLATAIGSSSDQPEALAELMGILLNDGIRRPRIRFQSLRFGADTPYETILDRQAQAEERVLPAAVARALRPVLADVVQAGTARRLAGAFGGNLGGKTGSGDNRFKTFARGGGVTSSRAVSRTAAFVFYIGDRYFGVMTASVSGTTAGRFGFTSALPVAVLKLLAPGIENRLMGREGEWASERDRGGERVSGRGGERRRGGEWASEEDRAGEGVSGRGGEAGRVLVSPSPALPISPS
jgi:membrane peptidoglycan carboxypeptidase